MTEVMQDGRIHIEKINGPYLAAGGNGEKFRAGLQCAVANGWVWLHESGTFVRFTDTGAAVFA